MDVIPLKVKKMLLAINKAYSSLNLEALKQKVEETYGETVAGMFPLSEEIVKAVADYIPELALAKPEWFGVCVVTAGGQVFEVGNCDQLFTIQSISKAFVFGLALEDRGREYVNSKVSVEPTGEAFNAIVLDEETNRPYNPMVNAGAIATADLIKGENGTERLKRVLEMFKRYTGRDHDINVPVFLSEKATGNRNRAMAYLMLNFGMVGDQIDETLAANSRT
ncbi:MAG: glutaminase [Limnospira sp.]